MKTRTDEVTYVQQHLWRFGTSEPEPLDESPVIQCIWEMGLDDRMISEELTKLTDN